MAERTAAKERTRRALLLAGIEVLSRNSSAPLGEVAAHAGVARSTLHRYFPDRQALLSAVLTLADEEYEAALVDARTDAGSGFEAFRRVCGELIDRLEVLMWWLHPDAAAAMADDDVGGVGGVGGVGDASDPQVVPGDVDGQPAHDAPDPRIAAVMARGHADGSIDPTMNVEWVEQLLWASLYAAAHAPAMTSLTGFEARSQALRSLLKAVATDPAAV